ncbi:hypothetical protein NOMA109596_18905 [Nocardioides marinus]
MWVLRATLTLLSSRSNAQISLPAPPSASAFQLPVPNSARIEPEPVVESTEYTWPLSSLTEYTVLLVHTNDG